MNKILLVLLLISIILVSGCTAATQDDTAVEEPAVIVDEPVEEIAEEPAEPEELLVVTEEEIISTPKPEIGSIIEITAAENPSLEVFGGVLHIAYQKYTLSGKGYGIQYATFDGAKEIHETFIDTPLDEVNPTIANYHNKLYLFLTQRSSETSATASVSFMTLADGAWSEPSEAPGFASGRYTTTSTAVRDDQIYLFYTSGLELQEGKIAAKLISGDTWLVGPQVTQATGNEKNPAIALYKEGIGMLYESYGGDENNVYYKGYQNKKWGRAIKLTDTPIVKERVGSLVEFNGNLYGAWEASGELYISWSADSENWSEPIQLTNNEYNDLDPDFEVFNDKLYLAWTSHAKVAPRVVLSEVSGV